MSIFIINKIHRKENHNIINDALGKLIFSYSFQYFQHIISVLNFQYIISNIFDMRGILMHAS